MILFLFVLHVRRPASDSPEIRAAEGLLRHLSLLFVPAGVGVMANLAVIERHWAAITSGFFASWLAGAVVAAGVGVAATALQRAVARPRDEASTRETTLPGSGAP
jgi:putative effector of murein hydrolase LrgA (UPF0299 family)